MQNGVKVKLSTIIDNFVIRLTSQKEKISRLIAAKSPRKMQIPRFWTKSIPVNKQILFQNATKRGVIFNVL